MYRDSPYWELKWGDSTGKITEGLVSSRIQLAALGMGKFREEILHMELVSIWRRISKDCGGGRVSAHTPGGMNIIAMTPGRGNQ